MEARAPLAFEPLVGAELEAWLANARASYIAERIDAGDSPDEAQANATASFERLVPGGIPVSGQHIGRIVDANRQPIGHLWVGAMGNDPTRWWVWDVLIEPEFRSHGHGRSAMVIAERLAREHGATSIGLNVFARNDVARKLYASLGYGESAVTMRKDLGQRSR